LKEKDCFIWGILQEARFAETHLVNTGDREYMIPLLID